MFIIISDCFQLFIMREETELQAISGDNLANNLQCLHTLKSKLQRSFGDHVVKQSPISRRTEQRQHSCDESYSSPGGYVMVQLTMIGIFA